MKFVYGLERTWMMVVAGKEERFERQQASWPIASLPRLHFCVFGDRPCSKNREKKKDTIGGGEGLSPAGTYMCTTLNIHSLVFCFSRLISSHSFVPLLGLSFMMIMIEFVVLFVGMVDKAK